MKKMLKREWVGRYVRLKVETRTRAGAIFDAGEVMRVHRNYNGLHLDTITVCEHCGRRHQHFITGVDERKVVLLDEGFEPDLLGSDHEAMEVLRRATLRRGWAWSWDGMDLMQVPKEKGVTTYEDPADALREVPK